MAIYLSAGPACSDRSWPEARLLTHLLRSAVASNPEPIKSLQGNHPVDIFQSQDAYELRTDAPGLSHDDILVEVDEDVLRITAGASKSPAFTSKAAQPAAGTPVTSAPAAATAASSPSGSAEEDPQQQEQQQRPESPPSPSWKPLRRERQQGGAWSRAFLLPETVDAARISVRLDRGVLTVHVPKCPPPPKMQPRRIVVNRG